MGAAKVLKPLIAANIALRPMKTIPMLLIRAWGMSNRYGATNDPRNNPWNERKGHKFSDKGRTYICA